MGNPNHPKHENVVIAVDIDEGCISETVHSILPLFDLHLYSFSSWRFSWFSDQIS
jgi:hypothetical protein